MSGEAYTGNPNLLELIGFDDQITGAFINDAVVTGTIVDQEGADVGGVAWPLSMAYVTGSDGDYRATVPPEAEFIAGDCYIAEVTATDSGTVIGYWQYHFTPVERG